MFCSFQSFETYWELVLWPSFDCGASSHFLKDTTTLAILPSSPYPFLPPSQLLAIHLQACCYFWHLLKDQSKIFSWQYIHLQSPSPFLPIFLSLASSEGGDLHALVQVVSLGGDSREPERWRNETGLRGVGEGGASRAPSTCILEGCQGGSVYSWVPAPTA